VFLIALVLTLATCAGIGTGRGATVSRTGTHRLSGELRLVSVRGDCPPGITVPVCAARTGDGLVPGLGKVTEAYMFLAELDLPPCGTGFGRALAYPVRFVVANKGEIDFMVAEAAGCVTAQAVRTQAQDFTITGGTGIYADASGSGTVRRVLGGETVRGRVGRETWTGTLTVPELNFDETPPILTGATAKTVRVPRSVRRARVVYTVTAHDDVDGPLAVTCAPRSGSRFRIGRTIVTCSATDSSANTRRARFTITVRARR
jgi:HYR domain